MKSADGRLLANNLYWQSTTDDDSGPPGQDNAFKLSQQTWADFATLNQMPAAEVDTRSDVHEADGWVTTAVTLSNRSKGPAFFLRAEVVGGAEGNEILPILWDDNYITLFAGESQTLTARYKSADAAGGTPFVRLEGYNVKSKVNHSVRLTIADLKSDVSAWRRQSWMIET